MILRHVRRLFRNENKGRDGRMMSLKKYGFYVLGGKMCTPKDVLKRDAYAMGKVYGRSGVRDGTVLRTYRIVDMYDNKIVTETGGVYTLESMHPDYKDFLAIEAAKTL